MEIGKLETILDFIKKIIFGNLKGKKHERNG